jgi:hypothetical protein
MVQQGLLLSVNFSSSSLFFSFLFASICVASFFLSFFCFFILSFSELLELAAEVIWDLDSSLCCGIRKRRRRRNCEDWNLAAAFKGSLGWAAAFVRWSGELAAAEEVVAGGTG